MASGATCVQRLDGSRDSAIHTKYRISLRSSSMREPRYPLPRVVMTFARHPVAPTRSANGVRGEDASLSIPWRIPRRGSLARTAWHRESTPAGETSAGRGSPPPHAAVVKHEFAVCFAGIDNDPSAGSPTETLLRLLLPLNDKVQWTSRDVAGGEPPTSPRSEHFTGPFNR